MDAGSNESNSKRLKPWKEGRGQHVTGEGKSKDMMYLFMERIYSRLWGDRLMQLLEVDQSVDRPYKILKSVQARVFLINLLSPAGSILNMGLQRR